jgi:hypothetical protein
MIDAICDITTIKALLRLPLHLVSITTANRTEALPVAVWRERETAEAASLAGAFGGFGFHGKALLPLYCSI